MSTRTHATNQMFDEDERRSSSVQRRRRLGRHHREQASKLESNPIDGVPQQYLNAQQPMRPGIEHTNVKSTEICKLGPIGPREQFTPIAELNYPVTLIIGDSISIGYTLPLRGSMKGMSSVIHTPLPDGGGAGSVVAAVNCIGTFFTNSSTGQPLTFPKNVTHPNVLSFNFGMHDYGETDEVYETVLIDITKQLFVHLDRHNFRMIYQLTTPVPYDVTLDEKVQKLNVIARRVMKSLETSAPGGKIPVVDLHKAISDRCGPVPFDHDTCSISSSSKEHPGPHYYPEGYNLLADVVVKSVRDAMSPTGTSDASLTTDIH
jgi:hypothetical protein